MGLLGSIAKVALPVVGNMIAPGIGGMVGGALAGAIGGDGSSQSGTATSTNQNRLDPRIDGMLFGQDGKSGLLSQYQNMLPLSQGQQAYQKAGNDYLSQYAGADMGQMRDVAGRLMQGNNASLASVPSYASGNMVQAPSQNGVDLSGAYKNMVYGDAGANPYLNQHLQSAVDLTNAGFQKNQTDLTNNLMRNILPSIGSSAVLAGQYGGSRQGIAEGNALSDYTNQLTNANLQLGLANSANTTGAQANAFNQGQDRALSAMQGLGAQQYGVAQQNAATKNAAEFMNVGNQFDASKFNAGTANAMTGQNNSALLGGSGLLGSLATGANGAANTDLARAQGVNGLLAPYLGANSSSTFSQPIYQNQMGNLLGGAMLGGTLFGNNGKPGSMNGATAANPLGTGAGSNPGSIFDLFKGSFMGN